MKITLTQEQYEELTSLEQGQILELTYNGVPCFIEVVGEYDYANMEYKGRKYVFNFFCPSEVEMHVKHAPKAQAVVKEIKEEKIEEAPAEAINSETPDFTSIKGVFKTKRFTTINGKQLPLNQWVGCVNGEWVLLRTTDKPSIYRSCGVYRVDTHKDGTRKADVKMSQNIVAQDKYNHFIAIIKPILVTY